MAGCAEIRNSPASSAERVAQILPFLLERRSENGLGAGLRLRQTCRALREAHDYAFQDVCLGSVAKFLRLNGWPKGSEWTETALLGWHPPAPTEIEASVRRRLARGFRPKQVSIELPWLDDRAACEDCVLVLLRTLAGTASIKSISLGEHAPLTAAVVQSLAAVTPNLTKLRLTYGSCLWDNFDVPSQPPAITRDDVAAAAATARQLFLTVGPTLRELELSDCDRYCPAQAVVDGLSYCTALTRLKLKCDLAELPEEEDQLAAEASLLHALSGLTNLRDLSLYGGARQPDDYVARKERAAELRDGLSALTALTRLDIGLHRLQHYPRWDTTESNEQPASEKLVELRTGQRHAEVEQLTQAMNAEWSALVAACRAMPHLAELRSPVLANAADLAALTALTYLRVGSIQLPPPHPRGGARQAHPPPTYDLPPRLHRLVVYTPMPPQVLAALRPGAPSPAAAAAAAAAAKPAATTDAVAGCPYIHVGGTHHRGGDAVQVSVALTVDDLDDQRAVVSSSAMRSLCDALTAVRERFKLWRYRADSERGLRVSYDDVWAVSLPSEASVHADGTHCGSWLGKLAELRLGHLVIDGFELMPRRMLMLARCMMGLRSLDLRGCSYVVAALPLLTGLRSLAVLRVSAGDWEWPQETVCADTVEAAFLALTTAPDLDLIHGAAGARHAAAASADAAAAREEVPGEALERASGADGADSGGAAVKITNEMVIAPPGLQLVVVHAVEPCDWLDEALEAVRAQVPAGRGVRIQRVLEGDGEEDDM